MSSGSQVQILPPLLAHKRSNTAPKQGRRSGFESHLAQTVVSVATFTRQPSVYSLEVASGVLACTVAPSRGTFLKRRRPPFVVQANHNKEGRYDREHRSLRAVQGERSFG